MSNNYDFVLSHKELSSMTDEDILSMLQYRFPDRCLYHVSTDWRKEKKYILKAKGTKGDVVIDWEENQSIGQKSLKHCPIL